MGPHANPPPGVPRRTPDGHQPASPHERPPFPPGPSQWPPSGGGPAPAGDSFPPPTEPVPGPPPESGAPQPVDPSGASKPPGKAGRDLPLAIGVGLVLGVVVLGSLLVDRRAFLAVVGIAVAVGVWELSSAMRRAEVNVPTWPLIGCGLGMLALTWFGGMTMLGLGLGLTLMVLVVWRIADGATDYHVDVPAAALIATYVPFLGGFAILMLMPVDGHLRIIATLATVVLSDTGGYVAGVLIGKHPMAPKVSPKKSWEGMGGSLLACAIGGAVLLHFMFDVAWWQGAVFGATIAIAATLGDLTESLIKRDLGVKDMSRLIPGHGGLMDRLDSILLVLPVAYGWLAYLAPAAS